MTYCRTDIASDENPALIPIIARNGDEVTQ